MLARTYTSKIEIWESQQVDDGFGGTTPQDVLIKKAWASKQTKGMGYKFQDLGLNDFKNPVVFHIRKGTTEVTEKMFVKIGSKKFIIRAIENVNLDNREINILCDEN
ncbi:phage head closure protein [Elizabethkingia anophelis]|nr:phage head closure protein [Elizabethkingia anophelis]